MKRPLKKIAGLGGGYRRISLKSKWMNRPHGLPCVTDRGAQNPKQATGVEKKIALLFLSNTQLVNVVRTVLENKIILPNKKDFSPTDRG